MSFITLPNDVMTSPNGFMTVPNGSLTFSIVHDTLDV